MSLIERSFRLAESASVMGLACTEAGVSLAGVPLLRKTALGFAPRPVDEINAFMAVAYGDLIQAENVSPRLSVAAKALNAGDFGRAMIATPQLRLPELSWRDAVRIARAHDGLSKYDPNEPRDKRGRWTTGAGAAPGGSAATPPPRSPRSRPWAGPRGRPAHLHGGRLIPTAGPDLEIGGNGPPGDEPNAEVGAGGAELRDPNAPKVPEGWDTPGQTIDGLSYPGTRNPTLANGTPWPTVTHDAVKSMLAYRPGQRNPEMVIYVPLDGKGPMLIGSTTNQDYAAPEGYRSVTFIGTPQITRSGDIETPHARDSIDEAFRFARSNQFEKIYFNRSFSNITSRMYFNLIRPDVVAVARPDAGLEFKYYPSEVFSGRQSPEMRQMRMPNIPDIARVDGRYYKALLYLGLIPDVRHV